MTKQTVNLGNAPNDGSGDKLRTAFRKINENFDELYEGSGVSGAQGAQGVDGAQGPQGAQGVAGANVDLLSVNTDIIPSANITYNIGSQDYQWKDIWVSNNTIFIGGVGLGIVNGQLTLGGNAITAEANTGDVKFDGDEIYTETGILSVTADEVTLKSNVGELSVINLEANQNSWTFAYNGSLVLPQDSIISEGTLDGLTTIELKPAPAAEGNVESQKLVIKGGGAEDYHLHLTTGDPNETSIFLGTDDHHVKIDTFGSTSINAKPNASVLIYTSDEEENSFKHYWEFAPNGTIQFPNFTTQTTAFTADPVLNLTKTNLLEVEDGIHEKYQSIANAIGTVTHDCSNGYIFYHTTPTDNWTADFTNLLLNDGYATTLTLVVDQGATPYYANTVLIDNSVTTINWRGNVDPTPNANRKDVLTFNILKTGGNFGDVIILGQLIGF